MTKHDNESIRALIEQYRPLLEAVPDAVLLVDGEGKILLANTQAGTLFGYAPAEFAGMQVDLLVPQRFRGHHQAHRASFHSDPKLRAMGTRAELFGLRKDGTE